MTEIKGLDISYCQKGIDYDAIISKGYKFVIIRAGNSMATRYDTECLTHFKECVKRGLEIGVYWYGLAINETQAKQEANWLIEFIEKNQLKQYITLPIYYDEEEQKVLMGGKVSEIVNAFREEIDKKGFSTGLYCSTGWIPYINANVVNKFNSVWIADWRNSCAYQGKYDIWQNGKTPAFGKVVADENIMINNILKKDNMTIIKETVKQMKELCDKIYNALGE